VWIEAGVILLVVLTLGLTILVVFLIWRDGYRGGWRAARNQAPHCPQCTYNLSGLTRTRCPECGMELTLDELWRTPVITAGALGRRRNAEEQHANDNGAPAQGSSDREGKA